MNWEVFFTCGPASFELFGITICQTNLISGGIMSALMLIVVFRIGSRLLGKRYGRSKN